MGRSISVLIRAARRKFGQKSDTSAGLNGTLPNSERPTFNRVVHHGVAAFLNVIVALDLVFGVLSWAAPRFAESWTQIKQCWAEACSTQPGQAYKGSTGDHIQRLEVEVQELREMLVDSSKNHLADRSTDNVSGSENATRQTNDEQIQELQREVQTLIKMSSDRSPSTLPPDSNGENAAKKAAKNTGKRSNANAPSFDSIGSFSVHSSRLNRAPASTSPRNSVFKGPFKLALKFLHQPDTPLAAKDRKAFAMVPGFQDGAVRRP